MKMLNDYCKELFGEKVYKLSLACSRTCPNRDETKGERGCIFCSGAGSGDFAESALLPVSEQIERAKARVSAKFKGGRYIAYFQAFTSTYAPLHYLEKMFTEAIRREDIAALSVATRPDCLDDGIYVLLAKLNKIKPVWVELGLQTIHPSTAEYIRRSYPLSDFDAAAQCLADMGIHTIVHLILGLPGETREDMLESVHYVCNSGAKGIKLQLLHVLEDTDLAAEYRAGKFRCMELDEYAQLVADCVSLLPEDMVIHRLTGDGDKKILIAPEWSGDKKRVLNTVNAVLREKGLLT